MNILVVDNYDSFVYTIVSYLRTLGADCDVVRNDDVSLKQAAVADGVLISPGPGTPSGAGRSLDVIAQCRDEAQPMLGVCLGHQALAELYGGQVGHAPQLMHGKTSVVEHDATGIFAGLPSPLTQTRYHSLAVFDGTFSDELEVNARTQDGIIMGLRHQHLPLWGVQSHPEAVLSEHGHDLFANWLALCGDADALARSRALPTNLREPNFATHTSHA